MGRRTGVPGHDERATDRGGRVLGSKDGDGGGLEAHSDSEQEASDEELGPGLGAGGSDGRKNTEHSGDEDGPTTSEPVVERVAQPAANKRRSEVRASVDDSDEPLVGRRVRCARRITDAELLRPGQVGSVGALLVPTLDGRADGAEDDGHVERLGLCPLVRDLAADMVLVLHWDTEVR